MQPLARAHKCMYDTLQSFTQWNQEETSEGPKGHNLAGFCSRELKVQIKLIQRHKADKMRNIKYDSIQLCYVMENNLQGPLCPNQAVWIRTGWMTQQFATFVPKLHKQKRITLPPKIPGTNLSSGPTTCYPASRAAWNSQLTITDTQMITLPDSEIKNG